MERVIVYTTTPCSFCRGAKGLLSSRGIAFSEVDLARDPSGRAELAQRTGMMTFPQVIIDDQPLGGFSELASADRDGRLQELLAA